MILKTFKTLKEEKPDDFRDTLRKKHRKNKTRDRFLMLREERNANNWLREYKGEE